MNQDPAEKIIQNLCDQTVEHFRQHFDDFPALESNATQIIHMAGKVHDVPVSELDILIRQDAAASVALMRLANSAKYARGKEIQTINDAIVRVGRQEVFSLMMALATRTLFDADTIDRRYINTEHWKTLHKHCVVSGFACAWLAKRLSVSRYETAFLGGMFHDIGKLTAVVALAQVLKKNKMKPEPAGQVERFVADKLHVELGRQVLTRWQMPAFIVDVCERHHQPTGALEDVDLHLVRVVSCLNLLADNCSHAQCQNELSNSLQALEITSDLYDGIRENIKRIRGSVDALMFRG